MQQDTSWVKLYRKSLYNEVRRHDPTAWRLFETLLMLVNSSTGTWSGGRYQLVEADGYLNSSTLYKALSRLQKYEMISINSNNRFSTIHICNFVKYSKSGNTSGNNQVTTNEQPSNTLTRSKNKEVRIYTSQSSDELRQLHEKICQIFGKNPNSYKLSDKRRTKLKARMKDVGKDGIVNACTAISQSAFHMGENNRTWIADPYWCLESFEKAEEWAGKHSQSSKYDDLTKVEIKI